MASTTTATNTIPQTTLVPNKPKGLPTETIAIIIATLGFICIVLAIILAYLCCKRKCARQDISSAKTGSSSGPGTQGTEPTVADDNPEYVSPAPPIELTIIQGTNTDIPTARSTLDDLSASTARSKIDLDVPIRAPDQTGLPDTYVNITDGSYENFNGVTERRQVAVPTEESSLAPPHVPHRRQASDDASLGSSLFKTGTKAYHMYCNAVQDYEMDRNDLSLQNRIGKGHFGSVFSGVAIKLPHSKLTNQEVAVKTMRGSATDSDKQEFLYEYEIMKLTNTLMHPNITKLLGSVTKSQPCMIVLELMTNGNLRSFLRATRSREEYYNLHGYSSSLSERQLLQFALDIANGMEGIADLQLLHRDLAARNILLDENLTCKIADFGFAKDVINKQQYKSKSVFQRPRPTRWLAPESLLHFKHSIMSDVWSYGIVLWEIVTLGNLPYPNMKKPSQVQHAISQGYRMPCPKHCSPDIYRVMSCCWDEKPNKRPAFPQIVDKMRLLLEKATYIIDMGKLEDNNDYIDVLPPDDQEIFVHYSREEGME